MRKRDRSLRLDRRQFVKLAGGAAIAASACSRRAAPPAEADPAPPSPAPGADRTVVRLASVPTAVEGNVLPSLIASFEQHTRYRVELTTSPELYHLARAGKVDLLVSLQAHLLAPAAQAQIRTIRYPGVDAVTWVPAGRHNRTAILPRA